MNGQQLKNSILQLAIQGKLVPQDPHDEPASVLLAKIREEKEQMVKEKKLKKKDLITTPISDDEKPFEIPEGWEWCRLEDLASHVVDCPHSTPQKVSHITNFPCIRTSEIKNGKIVWASMQYLDEINYNIRIKRLKPQEGDIVYAREGAYGDAVVLPNTHNFCLGQRTMMLRMVLRSSVDYVHQAIISPFVYAQATALNREGTTSVGHVNMSDIVKFVVPLPPLAEQHRIVEKIKQLMPLVDEYDKAQSQLNQLNQELPDRLKKSIIQEAIMGRLGTNDSNDEPASVLLAKIREEKEQMVKEKKLKKKDLITTPISDDEKPFEIPENWEWVRIRDLCCFALPSKRTGEYVCLDAKYLRGKSDITYLGSGNYVKSNSPIILVDGENSGEVFITPNEGYLGSTFKELFVTREIDFMYINNIFLLLKERMRNNKIGAAIPHLDKVLFFGSVVPLPPLAEQHRIVEKLETILPKLETLQKETQK